jgi:effector-binding domain-containing protein
MKYEVAVAAAPRRPIAAVAITTTWREFPGQWRGMLDEVYACLRQAGVASGCNVMHYRDVPGGGGEGGGGAGGGVAVAVGVEVGTSFPASGRVRASALPAGPAARTTHRGRYEDLGAAHQAVLRWCAAHGRVVTGERWEVYGDWHEDPDQLETEVFYALDQA